MQNESVHLPHFEGPSDDIPSRSVRLRQFYGDLARFASIAESGRVCPTPIRCRKRPGRKRCRGLLEQGWGVRIVEAE